MRTMPEYRLTWTRKNDPIGDVPQDDTTVTTVLRASTPEKATAKALDGAVLESDIAGATLTVAELDEDGDPIEV